MSVGSCEAIFNSLVKVRSRSSKKRSNSKFHKCPQKDVDQMQFELRKPMVSFVLLCEVGNMFKYAFAI